MTKAWVHDALVSKARSMRHCGCWSVGSTPVYCQCNPYPPMDSLEISPPIVKENLTDRSFGKGMRSKFHKQEYSQTNIAAVSTEANPQQMPINGILTAMMRDFRFCSASAQQHSTNGTRHMP